MKMVKFEHYYYKEMPLMDKIHSIFDSIIAGQIDTEGNYYMIHLNHITHIPYALTKESSKKTFEMGYMLEENEVAVFNGEKVRGMTPYENKMYNEDTLMAYVDLWGNIAVDKEFNYEW